MNVSFKRFAAFFGCTYSLIVATVSINIVESEMCLAQAITIDALLQQGQCPDHLLNALPEFQNCRDHCKGRFTTKNDLYDEEHCIAFNINFHLNDTLSSRLRDFPCGIQQCIIEVIEFECWFYTNITYAAFNETFIIEDRLNKDNCIAPATIVVVSLSCAVLGSLLGIGCLVMIKRFRKKQRLLDPTAVFYRSNDGEQLESVMVSNPMETEYAGIEESIKMISKAVQVPSYKEDSSSESRSRENVYHHLSLIEQSPKIENIVLNSSDNDSLTSSYAEALRLSRAGSQSVKSGVINTESLSSKSNNSPKASRTGSEDSDKYYALEEHDYLNSISNDKSS